MPFANGKTVIIKYFPNGKQDKDNFYIAAEAIILRNYKNVDGNVNYYLRSITELLFEPEKYIPNGVVPNVVNNHDEFWCVVNPNTYRSKNRLCPY